MIAHEYKHFMGSGTGLRSLLDTYVYLNQKGGELDWPYIESETQKLRIAEFERNNRELAVRLFSGEPLTEQDEDMLGYVLSSGTYGTMKNYVRNQIAKRGRLGYLLSIAFLPYRSMKMLYPILDPLPILLPICWVLRLVKAIITKPKKVLYQLTAAFKSDVANIAVTDGMVTIRLKDQEVRIISEEEWYGIECYFSSCLIMRIRQYYKNHAILICCIF